MRNIYLTPCTTRAFSFPAAYAPEMYRLKLPKHPSSTSHIQQRIGPSFQPSRKNKGTIYVPIIVNTVVVLATYGYFVATCTEINDIAGRMCAAMLILALFNFVGLIITAVLDRTKMAIGILLSISGIFLIGYRSYVEFAPVPGHR